MAKKKKLKNVVISDEELTPTVIGYLNEKKSSPLFLIVLFAILFVFLFYIPDIDVYVRTLLGQDVSDTGYTEVVKKEFNQNDAGKIFEYVQDSNIVMREITLTDFNITDDTLYFSMINADNNLVDFGSYNYYLYLLNEEKKALDIIHLSDLVVYEQRTIDVSFPTKVLSADVKYVAIDSLKDEYLNEIDLPFNALVCRKQNDEYKYLFDGDKKLTSVIYTFAMNPVSPSMIKNYTEMKEQYSNEDGVSVSLDTSAGINYQLNIDLTKVDVAKFNDKLLYSSGYAAKMINYEMGVNGYTCE